MAVRIFSETIFAIFVVFIPAKTRTSKAVRWSQKCLTRSRLNSYPKLFEDICKDYIIVSLGCIKNSQGQASTVIGQTEFCKTPQCTKHTYGACIIIVHMHGAHVRFFACEKSGKFRDRMRCSQRTVSCTDVSRLLINLNLSLNTLKLKLDL